MMRLAGTSVLQLTPGPSWRGIHGARLSRLADGLDIGTNSSRRRVLRRKNPQLNQVLSLRLPIAGKVTPVARGPGRAPGCRTLSPARILQAARSPPEPDIPTLTSVSNQPISSMRLVFFVRISFLARAAVSMLRKRRRRTVLICYCLLLASQASISGRRSPRTLMRYLIPAMAVSVSRREPLARCASA